MVHLKIVLDTRRKKSDGTYPITFRVTNVKKVHLIPAGISVTEGDWDKNKLKVKSVHPNSGTINVTLSKRFYEIQKAILQLEEIGSFYFEDLKSKVLPEQSKISIDVSFLKFANDVVDEFMSVKRTGNALVYKTAINRLMLFANKPKLEFKDIDYTFLDRFKTQLSKDGMSINTIGNYFRSIRSLFNKAIKAKIISRSLYPFHDISIKSERTAKRAIDVEELRRIYRYETKINSAMWHSVNFFFLSFALRGMSFTDIAYLKRENVNKDYISFKRKKTKKLYKIKLHPFASNILNFYKNSGGEYLIPVFPKEIEEGSEIAIKITRQWIKTTNKYLNRVAVECNVENNITTYVTRHTWATLAKKKLGYSNEVIAECLGHEYGNKITNIYLDSFDQSLIDEVNEKVIQLIE